MMFNFLEPFLTSSSSSDALLAAITIPLIISALRFVQSQGKSSPKKRELEPQPCETSSSETGIPAPPYLSCSIDDEELIGGNPIHLPPPRGPTGVTLTFCVYTPPSFDKEIPKVDVYGAINFVRTGKVRTFVQTGARRLLVINFQDMTLGVYVPKQSNVKKHSGKGASSGGPPDDDNPARGIDKRRPSGIAISTSARKIDFNQHDSADAEEESEGDWNPRGFESKPVLLLRLDDMVSVAAVPPRHGGVIEIASRSGGPPKQNDDLSKDLDKKKKPQKAKPSKQKGSSPEKKKKHKQTLQSTYIEEDGLHSSTVGDDCVGSDYVNTTISNEDKTNLSTRNRRDEFAFRTPRDAAQFQRVIMTLRTVGREVSYLYETLESIPSFPQEIDSTGTQESADETTTTAHPLLFASPGVKLDDAWHSMNEIPILKKGLYQFHLLSRHKEGVDTSRNVILDANLQKELAKREQEQGLLGLVDFFSLFVPPLPAKDAHVIPCFMPCAKTETTLEGNQNFMLARGIEWHYQRLSFVSALQRLVSRAAMFVRVYACARTISHDGWHLNGPDGGDGRDASDSQIADQSSDNDESQEEPRLSFDTDVQCDHVGEYTHDGVSSTPIATSNSTCQCPSPSNILHQGYSCVGWHGFRNPSYGKPSNHGDEDEVMLRPESDPLDCIPSLQALVKKHPHAHFFVYSCFNEEKSVVMRFLLVRSLPVGVDRAFDDTVHAFVCSNAEERDKRIGLALNLAAGNDTSTLNKITFEALIRALRRGLSMEAVELCPRIGSQMTLMHDFLASICHFGGSLQERDDMPMNYVAINSQFCLRKFPNILGRWLFGIVRACVRPTRSINFTFVVKAFSSTLIPERAITAIRMVNMSINATSGFREIPEVKNGESKIYSVDTQLESDRSISTTDDNNRNLKAPVEETHGTDMNRHNHHDELYTKDIDTILELLDGLAVPLRKRDQTRGEHNQSNQSEIITTEQIIYRLKRPDIERYLIACQCDLKSTVKRIVESESWRGLMFPVDTRQCQIEIQSGQFFQQGYDKKKNPIFYFRNHLLGLWRNDIHATALSVLHRLETFFLKLEDHQRGVKITLIASMGHPIENNRGQNKAKKKGKDKAKGEDEESTDTPVQFAPSTFGSDPRIDPYEEYRAHSSYVLLKLLNELIIQHYPERFAKVLIVPSKGQKKVRLASFPSKSSKLRLTVLSCESDLTRYVDKDELITFVGGNASITPDAFQSVG